MRKTSFLKMAGVLMLSMVMVFSFPSITIGQSISQESPLKEVQLASFPVTFGQFDHLDKDKGVLFVSLDKNGRRLEEISLAEIRAVYLLQGNKDRLAHYLVGGAGGLAGGFSGLILKNKALNGKDQREKTLETKEVVYYTSAGLVVGLLWGWWKGRGEEVRMFPVYDLGLKGEEYHNRDRIKLISPGAFIHVVKMAVEEGRK